ncbi:hypothetical protein CONPUDRAFT_154192 [Coniophora puteana RWD-64-598 SS2]|uniref:F-box domain-containing protein n=1 Tax=Coniophora puteana (strain RWD-64-598) TaxID=741705 RepID=A0A5M3MLN3_CONPW|nr:uncharacterized protein CONPUDRAFT_154192 [Coniophora puteana RWD-64-598 SS2]EIW80142.1 hypothetical protein CONPUDRAFT_154192 [Coniophora puteana RWD-64-598 SS2]
MFQEAAIHTLYSEVTDLTSFLRCLPDDLWKLQGRTFSFKRQMQAADWTVLLRYSSFVRSIIQRLSEIELDMSVYEALCHCPVPWLFPRLRRLEWRHAASAKRLVSHLAGLLFSPELEHVDIAASGTLVLENLPSIVARCPLVKMFDCAPHRIDHDDALSRAFCSWKHLERVSCDNPSPETMRLFTGLSSLGSLSLTISEKTEWLGLSGQDAYFSLPSLRSLTVHADTFNTCIAFFDALTAHEQHRLTLTSLVLVVTKVSESALSACLVKLPLILSHPTLRTLELHAGFPCGPRVTFADIAPLLVFHMISSFALYGPFTLALNDAQLDQLGQAWPNLETCHANPTARDSVERVSLRGLTSILRWCPHIRSLSLLIEARMADADAVMSGQAAGGVPVRNDRVTNLQLGDSSVVDEEGVALFLAQMMPRLRRIIAYGKFRAQWKAVEHGIHSQRNASI